MNRSIGIRFCGGCNPRVNRIAIAESLKIELDQMGCFIAENTEEAALLVYLNGCSAACSNRMTKDCQKEIWVAGTMVDGMEMSSEGEIVQEILLRVRDYFEGLAK